jgi:hypothetical protein
VTNVYRPTIAEDLTIESMIPMLRGGVAATSVYLKSVAHHYRGELSHGDRHPAADVPRMTRIEHDALDCAEYLIHTWEATSPVRGHPFAYGEPVVFAELRRVMNNRADAFANGAPQTIEVITHAFVGQIADAMLVLAFASGLLEVGIGRLIEYPSWNLGGAPLAMTYLHAVIVEHGWEVEVPVNLNWTLDFSEPPGSALNAILPIMTARYQN